MCIVLPEQNNNKITYNLYKCIYVFSLLLSSLKQNKTKYILYGNSLNPLLILNLFNLSIRKR